MKTLIIGGGLSGLALAEMMQAQGREVELLEARNRFGGRILTEHIGGAQFDMGPAWVWPGQPRIKSLIDRLGLKTFDQYAKGDLLYEDTTGQTQRGRGFASMQESWRLAGGLATLTEALAAHLTPGIAHLNAKVTAMTCTDAGITAKLTNGATAHADQVVLAMPPRLASTITCWPALPDAATRAMGDVATWMAGQAKALAIYDTPFWREDGLSGDATSRHGPLVEIHDASPMAGGPYALFGFVGVRPEGRQDVQRLEQHILAQLIRLFGNQAAAPQALVIKDWAADPMTATSADHAPLYAHPKYGIPPALTGLWRGRLLWAGSETGTEFGGYIEGALEAAEAVMRQL